MHIDAAISLVKKAITVGIYSYHIINEPPIEIGGFLHNLRLGGFKGVRIKIDIQWNILQVGAAWVAAIHYQYGTPNDRCSNTNDAKGMWPSW